MTTRRRRGWLAALALAAAGFALGVPPTARVAAADPSAPVPGRQDVADVPLLAYYYIWFEPASWNRAKSDLPLLGAYASEDETVMRRHIEWAKAAGIDGFIVSWKSTAALDKRLARLAEIATELDFRLAIIYQGLDFEREPLPQERIGEDLDHFLAEFASSPAFALWEKPLVIWSGSWRFTEAEIEDVVAHRRDRLLIFGSERDPAGVARLADLVDGQAYYWSSANPARNPRYDQRLQEMARATRDAGGRWIAPAAPGFDARLIGGTSVVERDDGATLLRELDAAMASLPDAVGLISWNEFTENSHVEPSRLHGDRYLDLLAGVADRPPLAVADMDSSAPEGADASWVSRVLALLGLAAMVAAGLYASYQRSRAQDGGTEPPAPVPRASGGR